MRGLFKDVVGAQAWQGVALLCTIVVQLTVARFIGPVGLGVTSIIIAASALCFFLVDLNLQSALVRAVLTATDEARQVLRRGTLQARVLLGLGLAPLAAAGAACFAPGHGAIIAVGIMAGVLAQELNPAWWLQGIGRAGFYFRLQGLLAALACLLAVPAILWLAMPGVENLILSLTVIIGLGAWWWRQDTAIFRVGDWRGVIGRYWGFARAHAHFILGGAAICLYLYPAPLLLASLRSVEEAGMYRVAMMPGSAYYVLTVAAFSTYYPRILRAHTEGPVPCRTEFNRILILVALAGGAACLAVVALQGPYQWAVGDGYASAIVLSQVLIVSKAIGGLVLVHRAVLLAQGRERGAFGLFLGVGVAALLANIVVIPRHGFAGAVMVELAQETIHLVLLVLILRRRPVAAPVRSPTP